MKVYNFRLKVLAERFQKRFFKEYGRLPAVLYNKNILKYEVIVIGNPKKVK